MRAFKDSEGREWKVSITVGAIQAVLSRLPDVNLANADSGDPPLITRLATDMLLLADVVYAIVEPQAEKIGISQAAFAASLTDDAFIAMHNAFFGELSDFFRKTGRGHLAAVIEKQQEVVTAAVGHAELRVRGIDAAALVEAKMQDGAPTTGR